jgi:uncharacterized protein (TIGR02145 family)
MKQLAIFLFFINICTNIIAQSVGVGITIPNVKAKLEVASNTQGFLPPRMTLLERDAIVSPATGLTIYCTNCKEIQVYSEGRWKNAIRDTACIFCGQAAVSICNKEWTTKNLDVDHYRNGDIIPQVTDPTAWSNLTTGAWCYYNNDPEFGSIYGKLYNSYAVTDPRGLAPLCWHIPSDAEWDSLANCLGGINIASGKMKEIGTAHWLSPNTGADNSSGFTALPGGYRTNDGVFYNFSIGYFWSSTVTSTNDVWFRMLFYNSSSLFKTFVVYPLGNRNAYSVRCLRD